ncbi:MAG: CPBP family intramembrane metalloprotease [Candidatus Micrarchaeota archaeon]|nr:CPBP family intramembrane metalloprotease [Candidatus Micrarchaeota archaeon]MDE1849911.1 CPBP family intramembrane metalloprotease [Candidatus Micrarchaeota archaeon]
MARGRRKAQVSSGILAAVVFVAIYLLINLVSVGTAQYVYSIGLVSYNSYYSGINALTSLSFAAAVFAYLVFYKRKKLGRIADELKFGRRHFGLGSIAFGLVLFLAILALEAVTALYSSETGTQINTNIGVLLAGATLWVYLFTAFVAPVCEELMFRGFLVPRIGIVMSAVIFGAGHIGYMSTSYVPGLVVQAASSIVIVLAIAAALFRLRNPYLAFSILIIGILFISGYLGIEVVSALIFGLMAGYVFKKTNSLYPSVIAHVLVNSIAVIGFVYGVGGGA